MQQHFTFYITVSRSDGVRVRGSSYDNLRADRRFTHPRNKKKSLKIPLVTVDEALLPSCVVLGTRNHGNAGSLPRKFKLKK